MSKEISQTVTIEVLDSKELLSPEFQKLLIEAENALASAYSIYSGFSVGAAALLGNNEIVRGSNQENIAYPSGLCAERVAIFSASTNFPNVPVKAIAIIGTSIHGSVSEPVTPCGSCRQVLIESETRQQEPITVIMAELHGKIWVSNSVNNLIPFYFSSPFVGKIK